MKFAEIRIGCVYLTNLGERKHVAVKVLDSAHQTHKGRTTYWMTVSEVDRADHAFGSPEMKEARDLQRRPNELAS